MLNMLPPQLMQMMQAQNQGVPMGPTLSAIAPGMGGGQPVAPATPNPMALMQAQQRPMMGGMGAGMGMMPQGAAAGAPNTLQALGGIGGLSQLLRELGGGQQGISPQQSQGLLSGVIPGFANMLGGYNWGGMPGQGVLNQLSNQAAGNVAGGAAGL